MAVRDLELHGAVHKNGEEYYLIRDMVGLINVLTTLANELRTDHATYKTLTDELHVDVDLNGAALEAILTKLDNDGGITDTNYVSLHGRSGSGTSIQAAAVGATDVAAITAAVADSGKFDDGTPA